MLEWICEESLLKFVSDMMVVNEFLIFLKCVRCKFINLSLSLKIFNVKKYLFLLNNFIFIINTLKNILIKSN